MNCKEFKDIVVCLFDTEIDNKTKVECEKHIAMCTECRQYYLELKTAFDMLTPVENTHTIMDSDKHTKNAKPIQKLWIYKLRKYVAAVIIFIIGFVVGMSHLFSSNAVAKSSSSGGIFNQAIYCVQNVGSFQMDIYARTLPNENFQYLDEKADFVKISIKLMRQDGKTLYRVEKEGGRVVMCDGENLYMWVGNTFVKEGLDVNFLERFQDIIYPEKLLALQSSSVTLSTQNKVIKKETDSTMIVVTEHFEKNMDLQQLFEKGKMDNCIIVMENVFSKNDGLLRNMKIYLKNDTGKHLMMYCNDIQYNTMMNKSSLIALPKLAKSQPVCPDNNITNTTPKTNTKENAQQAAQRIIGSLISGNINEALDALYYYKDDYAALHNEFKGCTASDFVIRQDADYLGSYVFYTLTTADGKTIQKHIAVRNDNDQHAWIADGGL